MDTVAQKKQNRSKLKKYDNIWGILFTVLPIIGTVIFVFIPFFITIFVSFTSWSGQVMFWEARFKDNIFQNYIDTFKDEYFWKSLGNTLFYMIGIPIGLIFALLIALGMNREMKFTNAFKVIYYIPVVASIVSIVILFSKLFDVEGIINKIIMTFGGKKVLWVDGAPWLKKTTIIIMMVWKGLGATILLYLAGLQGINKTYYEAAKLDGAGSFKIFTKITLPQLYPVIFFLLVTNIIGGAQLFTEPALFYPRAGYEVLPLVSYLKAKFDSSFAGRSAAVGIILMIIILIATAVQFGFNSKKEKNA